LPDGAPSTPKYWCKSLTNATHHNIKATLGILAQTSKYFYKLSDNSTELFKRSFLANYDAPQGATHLVTDQNAHWKHWVIFISEIEEIQRLYWKKGKANINGGAF
jgi:hypothetical protein